MGEIFLRETMNKDQSYLTAHLPSFVAFSINISDLSLSDNVNEDDIEAFLWFFWKSSVGLVATQQKDLGLVYIRWIL